MLGGAVLAARHDVEFDASGYFWMGANCCSTASYVLYMNSKSKTVNLTSMFIQSYLSLDSYQVCCFAEWGMVFYNNVISLPILLPVAILTGELPAVFGE